MRIRNIDSKGDWLFGQSQSNYVRNEYAVALDIKMKLQEWYQDCFFALTNGIPWSIRLGYKNQKQQLDKDIYDTALSVEGVLNIQDFESSDIGRKYTAKFNVYTQYSLEPIPFEFNNLQGVING